MDKSEVLLLCSYRYLEDIGLVVKLTKFF